MAALDTTADAASEAAPDGVDWSLLGEGDDRALERVFRRHADAVHAFAFRRLASYDLAEDVVQATFTAVWQRARAGGLEPLRLPSARPYLLVVAGNECRNVARSARRRQALLRRVAPVAAHPDQADEAASRVDDELSMSEVRRALRRIPARQREAVELVVWSGCTLAEAAEALGVGEQTVKSRLHRARRSLAGIIDLDEERS